MFSKWIEQRKHKSRLRFVFDKAEIRMNYHTKNDKVFIYPVIREIVEDAKKLIFTFTIPTGFNPDSIYSKQYIFRQVFGEHITLSGDDKQFTLKVYKHNPFPASLVFDMEQVIKQAKQLNVPIVCGLNEEGELIVYDMAKHPHLLIAGETGSGKSNAIRAILSTLIACKQPNDLHLYLGDLKRSELHLFRHIEHVKALCTDKGDLLNVLIDIHEELKLRGELLDRHELSNISEYNSLFVHDKKPYIVVCIDEVAMLHGNEDVMGILDDIAAIGRALSITLILSMQRPDSEVLNSRLKSNLTVRMAFKAADEINSRIILGRAGAEDIEHVGRMLLKLEKIQAIQFPELGLNEAKKLLLLFKINKPVNSKKATGSVKTVWGCL